MQSTSDASRSNRKDFWGIHTQSVQLIQKRTSNNSTKEMETLSGRLRRRKREYDLQGTDHSNPSWESLRSVEDLTAEFDIEGGQFHQILERRLTERGGVREA